MAGFDLTAKRFNDEDAAREYLEAIRWPDGPICPHCGCIGRSSRLEGKSHRKGLLFCGDCRKQYSVTVKTVFERSKIPLNKWVLACHLLCASKKGMSSHQLHRMLGVTYKSAWFMTHRIREAMKPDGGGLLGSGGGVVEVDETFWGNVGKQKKGARGFEHKMKVLSLVERGGEKRSFHVPNVTAKTLGPILREHISPKARLHTDENRVYKKLACPRFQRIRVRDARPRRIRARRRDDQHGRKQLQPAKTRLGRYVPSRRRAALAALRHRVRFPLEQSYFARRQ